MGMAICMTSDYSRIRTGSGIPRGKLLRSNDDSSFIWLSGSRKDVGSDVAPQWSISTKKIESAQSRVVAIEVVIRIVTELRFVFFGKKTNKPRRV